MKHPAILSTGRAVPPVFLSNAVMDERFGPGVSDWLVKNTGIEGRYHLAEGQVTSDLAAQAGRQALERAGLKPGDVQLLIVATDTPDMLSPATAAVVAHKLGAHGCGVFDLNTACAGFVTALDLGCRYLQADASLRHVLVIGAYGMSRFIDWTDKNTATLFADGAGAVVLGRSATPGFLASTLWSDASMWDALGIFEGGTARPAGGQVVPHVKFVKKFPRTYNTEHWPRLIRQTLDKAGRRLEDVKLFVFTQLNLRTIEEVMRTLDRPLERTHWVMNKWGYTGSGCIPMTLDDALEQKKLARGDLLAFCASGGGVAMASAVFEWTA